MSNCPIHLFDKDNPLALPIDLRSPGGGHGVINRELEANPFSCVCYLQDVYCCRSWGKGVEQEHEGGNCCFFCTRQLQESKVELQEIAQARDRRNNYKGTTREKEVGGAAAHRENNGSENGMGVTRLVDPGGVGKGVVCDCRYPCVMCIACVVLRCYVVPRGKKEAKRAHEEMQQGVKKAPDSNPDRLSRWQLESRFLEVERAMRMERAELEQYEAYTYGEAYGRAVGEGGVVSSTKERDDRQR